MILETERLRIIALDLENLVLCRKSRKLMEENLGLNITSAITDPETEKELKIALEIMIDLVREDPENYLWNTNWEIVLKEENRIIGGFGFQGCPDTCGNVQVGYIIQKQYRKRGYATEALKKMIEWAFNQSDVRGIVAETQKDNLLSQKVLKKVGMNEFRYTEDSIWWKIEKKDFAGMNK